jgi:hypothetical protein
MSKWEMFWTQVVFLGVVWMATDTIIRAIKFEGVKIRESMRMASQEQLTELQTIRELLGDVGDKLDESDRQARHLSVASVRFPELVPKDTLH